MIKITDEILVNYFLGECSPEEEKAVEQWCDTAPENMQKFKEYALISDNAFDEPDFTPNVDTALNKVHQKINVPEQIQTGRKPAFLSFARIAAIFIIAIGVGIGYIYLKKNSSQLYTTIETEAGQKQKIQLEDGTSIWLNENSKLTYPEVFNKSKREVSLEGEAYFVVEKAAQWPFTIQTQNNLITVVGTQFNVRESSGKKNTLVSVKEGIVEFADAKQKEEKVQLLAGEQGTFNVATQKIKKEKLKSLNYDAWKTGQLIFKDTPLKEVIKEISDFHEVEVILEKETLWDYPLTTTFETESLSETIEILEKLYGLSADSDNEIITLK